MLLNHKNIEKISSYIFEKRAKKGVFAFTFVFIIVIMFLLVTFSILIPLALQINTELHNVGEYIVEQINVSSYPNETMELIQTAKSSFATSANILSYLIQYSWLIIIIVVALIIFIMARTSVEYPQHTV